MGGIEGVEDEELAADEGAGAGEVRRVVEGRGREGAVACLRVRADVEREAGAAVDVEAVARVGLEVRGRRRGASSSAAARWSWAAPEGEGVASRGRLPDGVDDVVVREEGDG